MNKMIPTLLVTFLLFGCQGEAIKKDVTTQNTANAQPQSGLQAEDKKPKETNLAIQVDSQKLDSSDIAAHKQSLEDVSADKSCDTNTQCKVIAVGARACGGPSSYLVYSTKSANEKQVMQLADQITKLERAFNKQNQMMSICQHLIEPATQCVENKCVKLQKNHSAY